jgi:hypothetical protein
MAPMAYAGVDEHVCTDQGSAPWRATISISVSAEKITLQSQQRKENAVIKDWQAQAHIRVQPTL